MTELSIFYICTTVVISVVVICGAYVLGKACDIDKEKYKSQKKE